MEDGGWRMEDGGWRMEDGGWRFVRLVGERLMTVYRRHTDLPVYGDAFEAAMQIFRLTKSFPKEERYSLTDQIRRSSRSVAANIAEAWRKRRSKAFFVSTLNISEAEAAETQVWLQFAVKCEYLDNDATRPLYEKYDSIIGQLSHLIQNPDRYMLPYKK